MFETDNVLFIKKYLAFTQEDGHIYERKTDYIPPS